MTGHLGALPADDGRVTVTDLRTPQQKQHRRDSIFSAIMFLGDADMEPPALFFLKDALQRQPQSAGKLSLEVSEFRVIDYFPVRLRATAAGRSALDGQIMDILSNWKTDNAFIERLDVPQYQNSAICVVAGRLNGRPVKAAAFRAYKESYFAISVRNDPSFKDAVMMSIDACARDLVSQLPKP